MQITALPRTRIGQESDRQVSLSLNDKRRDLDSPEETPEIEEPLDSSLYLMSEANKALIEFDDIDVNDASSPSTRALSPQAPACRSSSKDWKLLDEDQDKSKLTVEALPPMTRSKSDPKGMKMKRLIEHHPASQGTTLSLATEDLVQYNSVCSDSDGSEDWESDGMMHNDSLIDMIQSIGSDGSQDSMVSQPQSRDGSRKSAFDEDGLGPLPTMAARRPERRHAVMGLQIARSVAEYLARNSPTLQGLPRLDEAKENVSMWACSVAQVRQLGEIRMHESMVVDGLLEDLDVVDSFNCSCSFLSHTWMSFDHPDPKGVKYDTLIKVLDAASSGNQLSVLPSEGTIKERRDQKNHAKSLLGHGYLWMDFWSVPQKDFQKQSAYINRIPQFVQRCSMFIVLAPPCKHEDTGDMTDIETWKGRGWCRLELLANTLSPSPSPCLLMESTKCKLMPSWWEWRSGPVGESAGFACCKLGHVHPNGKSIKCDKKRIAGMIEKMVDARLQEAEEAGDDFSYQLVTSVRGHFMRGLPVPA
jgi:hypothetical protein